MCVQGLVGRREQEESGEVGNCAKRGQNKWKGFSSAILLVGCRDSAKSESVPGFPLATCGLFRIPNTSLDCRSRFVPSRSIRAARRPAFHRYLVHHSSVPPRSPRPIRAPIPSPPPRSNPTPTHSGPIGPPVHGCPLAA